MDLGHPNADCINENAGFSCQCQNGLTGDGKSCEGCVVDIQQIGKNFSVTSQLLDKMVGFTAKDTLEVDILTGRSVNVNYSETSKFHFS